MGSGRRNSQRAMQRRRARFFGDFEETWAGDGPPQDKPPHERDRTHSAAAPASENVGERRDEMRLEGDAAVTRDALDSLGTPIKPSER